MVRMGSIYHVRTFYIIYIMGDIFLNVKMTLNETISLCLNATTRSDFIECSAPTFIHSIASIFILFILLMMLLGMILIRKDRANFYEIFIFSSLVMGIALFFTF